MKLSQVLACSLVFVLSVTGSFSLTLQNQQWYSPLERTSPLRAAIIDELAVTSPDPYLIQNVTSSMKRAGYIVDYYGPKDVTVDLFKGLPSKEYGIVILRDHSTDLQSKDVIGIVTSEPFSQEKYQNERQAGRVIQAHLGDAKTDYFGITPTFVRETMQGTFPHTILILMGCAGLANSEMAQAFVARGAEVYISWDQIIYSNRSDGGIILLLQSMTKGHTVDDATIWATQNAPTSPDDSSRLGYYPLNKGGLFLNLHN